MWDFHGLCVWLDGEEHGPFGDDFSVALYVFNVTDVLEAGFFVDVEGSVVVEHRGQLNAVPAGGACVVNEDGHELLAEVKVLKIVGEADPEEWNGPPEVPEEKVSDNTIGTGSDVDQVVAILGTLDSPAEDGFGVGVGKEVTDRGGGEGFKKGFYSGDINGGNGSDINLSAVWERDGLAEFRHWNYSL